MEKRKYNALRELLLRGSKDQIQEAIDSIHPADILEVIHEDPDNTKLILESFLMIRLRISSKKKTMKMISTTY